MWIFNCTGVGGGGGFFHSGLGRVTHAGAGTGGARAQEVMRVLPKKLGVQWAMEGRGFSKILGFGDWIAPVTERPGVGKA